MNRYSTAYDGYEAALKRLHELGVVDQDESPEAEQLSEEMDALWKKLTDGERSLLRGLSADLYSLSGDELPPPDAAQPDKLALLEAADAQFNSLQWAPLLETLRRITYFPPAARAFMRGRCWLELGRPEPALWFLEYAHLLDPSEPMFEQYVLDAMLQSSRKHEAVNRALELLSATPPLALYAAARIVSGVAGKLSPPDAAPLYAKVAAALESTLKLVAGESIGPTLLAAAQLALAIAYERLGEPDRARRAYDEAVAKFPDIDETVIARAAFLLAVDRASALRDLRALTKKHTANVWAYYLLAHEALVDGHFDECIGLCERVLRDASVPLMRAHASEWAAIAMYGLSRAIEQTRRMFQRAAYFAPFDRDILDNLEVAENLSREPNTVPDFAIARPLRQQNVADELLARVSAGNAVRAA